jgi:cell division transport system permease protein
MCLVVCLVIIMNTIFFFNDTATTEIEIMKLVGATDWFVRWPFLLEGIFGGILGAVLAGLVVLGIYKLVVSLTSGALFAIPFDGLFTIVVIAGLFAGGAVIGAIGSYLGVRRFLAA